MKAPPIISAHPGLQSAQEKALRLAADETWSERFKVEPWQQLMSSWNSQAVFAKSSVSFKREEGAYSRQALASALKNWSLGEQDDLTSFIKDIKIPILWRLVLASSAHNSCSKI